MVRNIVIIVLAVAVVATGYWGYQEHQEKNAILTQAENNYQQAFHDLVYSIDQLQDHLGSTLAMSSPQSLSSSLAQVWRITSMAHSNVGQLPLTLMPFNHTEEFLSNVGELSYNVTKRDLDKKPLTDQEYDTLENLYEKSSDIQNELRSVQAVIMKNHLRWMDVKMALASQQEPADNEVVNGLKTVDKKVQGYDDVNWGPEVTQTSETRETKYNDLKGEPVSEQQAKQAAREFLGLSRDVDVKITRTGEKSNYNVYSASLRNPKTNADVHMDITKIGGHPLWMIQERKNGEANIGLNKAQRIAGKFLKQRGKKQMKVSKSEQYDNVGVFTFVKTKDDVFIYPESITVKVSLDDGTVVGYDAGDYLAFQKQRDIGKPKLSPKEAIKNINRNVDVKLTRTAIITDDHGDEQLCYEVLGTINDDTYRIFINADTGEEVQVKKLDNPTPIYQSA